MPARTGLRCSDSAGRITSSVAGTRPKRIKGRGATGRPCQAAWAHVHVGHEGGHGVPCGASSSAHWVEHPTSSSRPVQADTRELTPTRCSTSSSEKIRSKARAHRPPHREARAGAKCPARTAGMDSTLRKEAASVNSASRFLCIYIPLVLLYTREPGSLIERRQQRQRISLVTQRAAIFYLPA